MARHRAEDMKHNHLEENHMDTNQTPAKADAVKASEPQVVKPAEAPEPKTPEKAEHTMERGDTLRSVAARYGTSPEYLAKINEIEDPNAIKVDQTIKLKV